MSISRFISNLKKRIKKRKGEKMGNVHIALKLAEIPTTTSSSNVQ